MSILARAATITGAKAKENLVAFFQGLILDSTANSAHNTCTLVAQDGRIISNGDSTLLNYDILAFRLAWKPWRSYSDISVDTTYRVAKTSIFHLDEDFILPHLIQNNVLKDEWGMRCFDHKGLCWNLFLGDHSGTSIYNKVRETGKTSMVSNLEEWNRNLGIKPGDPGDELDPFMTLSSS